MKKKLKGICIKEYKDEDDQDDFLRDLINYEDIRVYKKGQTKVIYKGYDKKYWKELK